MNRDTARFRWVAVLAGVTAASILIYCLGYSVQALGQNVLSVLATLQATVFAIVFSVLILGVQLSASRYSPRLASIFTADPDYRWTVAIFLTSIGYDVILLFSYNAVQGYTLTVLVLISIGLAAGAFWVLYEFVEETLWKTTPEGILERINRDLSPESIEEGVTSKEDTSSSSPYLPLISLIKSMIGEADRVTATSGLEILGETTGNLLASLSPDKFDEGEPIDQSLETVWVSQIPDIAEEALREELVEVATETSEQAGNVGEIAIEEELERPIELVTEGQMELIDEIGYTSSAERVRREAIDTSRDLLMEAAENQLWYSSAVGTRRLAWISAASIMNRNAGEAHDDRYTSLLILYFPKLLHRIVDSGAHLTEYKTTAWLRDKHEDVDPVNLLLWSAYDSMAELSSAALRFEMKTDQQIVAWDRVGYGWSDGFDQLRKTPLTNITQLWFGTMLYFEYLRSSTTQDVMEGFDPNTMFQVDSNFADETIRRILNGEIDPRPRVNLIPGGVNPVEAPRSGYQVSPVTDPEESFRDWLQRRKHLYHTDITTGWDEVENGDDDE